MSQSSTPPMSEHDSDAALQRVLSDAVAAVGADSGTIHLMGPDGVLHLRAASPGIPEAVLEKVRRVPVGKGMAGLAVERDRPVDACNIQTDTSGDVQPGAKATGFQGAIVMPIRREGKAVGALGVGCRAARTFTADDIAKLERCADEIGQNAD